MQHIISLIAAIGERTGVIGKGTSLPWSRRLDPDLHRFRELTTGKPVVMGRRTWESLPEKVRPLPNRQNIVVTRDQAARFSGAKSALSVLGALGLAEHFGSTEIMVIGGAQIYRHAIPRAHRLYLTLVGEDPEGDAFFPSDYERVFSRIVSREMVPHDPPLTFLTLERG